MKQLIDQLDEIDWTDRRWRAAAADILTDAPELPYALAAYIRGWGTPLRAARFNGSHLTTTHDKYLVYRDENTRFTLWLHDYKPAAERGPGYAEVPHNHRYDLCSIILHGGYDSVLYDVSSAVTPTETDTFGPGDVLSLTQDQVHSLTSIVEGTQTLFIEGPVLSHFSTVYPLDGPPRQYFDFDGKADAMLHRLDGGV